MFKFRPFAAATLMAAALVGGSNLMAKDSQIASVDAVRGELVKEFSPEAQFCAPGDIVLVTVKLKKFNTSTIITTDPLADKEISTDGDFKSYEVPYTLYETTTFKLFAENNGKRETASFTVTVLDGGTGEVPGEGSKKPPVAGEIKPIEPSEDDLN